jgi:hypothetical protein
MNYKTLTSAIAVALGMALSACGSTGTHATSGSTVSSTIAAAGLRATAVLRPSLLPEPTGAFSIGVRIVPSVSLAATTRVWYPARSGSGTGAPVYLADTTAAAYGLPAKQLKGAVPRASVNAEPAPTANARAAVVLMPGWGLPMALSTALAQDLASNGYVVVTVDPTYGTEDQNTLPPDPAHPGRRLEQISAAIAFAVGPRISTFAGPSTRTRSQSEVTPSPAPSRSRWASLIHACTRSSISTDGSMVPRWQRPFASPHS